MYLHENRTLAFTKSSKHKKNSLRKQKVIPAACMHGLAGLLAEEKRKLDCGLILPLAYTFGVLVYVPVGFKSGLRLGILGHDIGRQSRQSLVETDLQNLVLDDLDLDLALEVTVGEGNHLFGRLVDFLVGCVLGDSQFAVEFAAFQLELALLGFLCLDDVPWELLEGVGDAGQGREFRGA